MNDFQRARGHMTGTIPLRTLEQARTDLREEREMSEQQLLELTAHLCTLVEPWTQHGLHSEETKAECRRVGERLNKIGGMDAMIEAYYAAKAVNRCASVVQAYWDGIGDWRW